VEVKKLLPVKWSTIPGPVKLAWAVFLTLSLVASGVIIWGFVEVVLWLTSK
jgi:hypothetical protein